jgi:selenocysteine lyase/cysteine desulfurase
MQKAAEPLFDSIDFRKRTPMCDNGPTIPNEVHMLDRRNFVTSLLGLGSLELLDTLEAAAANPQAELPTIQAVSALGPGRPDDEKYWQKVRALFYVSEDILYLNNGSLGLSHRAVVEAMYRHLLESENSSLRKYGEYPWWGYGPSIEIRRKVASFIGADPEEIVLTRNATEGMNTVASGLDLAPGDEVLMSDQEHPGGRSPWYQRAKRYGISVKEFEMPKSPKSTREVLGIVEGAITPRTRVISVSHITTVTGGMLPVKEIADLARRRNILSLFDGAHAIGQLPLDMHEIGCDYYATSPHKWLFAPKGTGVLYCRKGLAEKLWCHTASGTWDQRELGCERLTNVGTSNYSLLVGLVAAMEFQERLGKDLIAERGRYLNSYLRGLLSKIDGTWFMNGPPPDLSTSMVKVALPIQNVGDFPGRMWEKYRIWLQIGNGDGKVPASIRFSLPAYVGKSDLDRTVDLIKSDLLRT